jgi:hypothetical protein
MKIVLFQRAHSDQPRPGLLTDRGIVDVANSVPDGDTPQDTVRWLIDGFDGLRPVLERLAATDCCCLSTRFDRTCATRDATSTKRL